MTRITTKHQVNKSRKSTSILHIIVVGLITEKTIYLLFNILCTRMCYEQLMDQQTKLSNDY